MFFFDIFLLWFGLLSSGEGSGADDQENQADNSDTDNEEQLASDLIKQVSKNTSHCIYQKKKLRSACEFSLERCAHAFHL
jgi:hypothetical protein